jgi:hypothetical protein
MVIPLASSQPEGADTPTYGINTPGGVMLVVRGGVIDGRMTLIISVRVAFRSFGSAAALETNTM